MSFRQKARAFSELATLQREVNQLFERLSEFDRATRGQDLEWMPPTDVFECRGQLVVVIEVPGLQPDSLKVAVRESLLSVTGERRERRPAGMTTFHCMERPVGRFTREVPIDRALDLKSAQARLERGLLTVTIPRVKDRRGRETVISVERT